MVSKSNAVSCWRQQKKVKQESYERKNYNQTTRQSGKVFEVIGFLKVKPRCEFKLFAVLFLNIWFYYK